MWIACSASVFEPLTAVSEQTLQLAVHLSYLIDDDSTGQRHFGKA